MASEAHLRHDSQSAHSSGSRIRHAGLDSIHRHGRCPGLRRLKAARGSALSKPRPPAPHRAAIESALAKREQTLFNLDHTILLYDLTSTYFEGKAHLNPKAKRGYSRDHRPDCKQVVVGLVIGLRVYPRHGWLLLLAFGIATYITVQLPGWFFPHYYQLWFPPLVIGAGWAVELLRRVLPRRLAWSSYALAGLCFFMVLMMEIPCYLTPAKSWSVQKYGGTLLETEKLAARIDNLLPPNGTFYVWGNEPGFYFTTQREPPSGLIFAYPMQDGPLVWKLSEQLLQDLKRNEPEVIITAVQLVGTNLSGTFNNVANAVK